MSRLSIKLNLMKFKGAFYTTIQGKTAAKKCICIPVEDAGLFVGEKGIYADLVAWELNTPKENQTHIVKRSIPKEKLEAMTEQEKEAEEILGNVSSFKAEAMQPSSSEALTPEEGKDLPF